MRRHDIWLREVWQILTECQQSRGPLEYDELVPTSTTNNATIYWQRCCPPSKVSAWPGHLHQHRPGQHNIVMFNCTPSTVSEPSFSAVAPVTDCGLLVTSRPDYDNAVLGLPSAPPTVSAKSNSIADLSHEIRWPSHWCVRQPSLAACSAADWL